MDFAKMMETAMEKHEQLFIEREKSAQLAEKLAAVITEEAVSMRIAERALDQANEIIHARTIVNFTCQ